MQKNREKPAFPLSELYEGENKISSRATIFRAKEEGHLKTFKIGPRNYTTPQDRDDWLAYLQRMSEKGTPVVYQPRSREHCKRTPSGKAGA
jgi:hypothetical protein